MIRFLLNRIALLFGLILVVGVGSVVALQVFYVAPKKACEKGGDLWIDAGKGVPHGFGNTCATPMDIRNMPRLPETDLPAAEAAPAPAAPTAKS